MLIRIMLAAAFGLLNLAVPVLSAYAAPALPIAVPSNLVLAQLGEAKTKAEDEAEEKDKERTRRGRSGAKDNDKAEDEDRSKQRARGENDRPQRDKSDAEKAEQEAEAKAKTEAAQKAAEERRRGREADAKAKEEAEAKAKAEAAQKAAEERRRGREADAKAKAEAEAKAKADATQKAAEERRRGREADAKAKEEAEAKAKAEAAQKAAEERRRAKAEADAKARAEAEAKAKAAADAKAKAEAEAEARAKAAAEKQKAEALTKAKEERKAGTDRQRAGRDAGERRARRGAPDDARARELARQREQEKTPAQELTKIQVLKDKPVTIDGGTRTLRRDGDRLVVRSDDTRRLRSEQDERRVERLSGGQTRTIVRRPDGTELVTITDARGEAVRRSRRGRDGREIVFFDAPSRPPLVELNLGPLRINIPREQYFYEYRRGAPRYELERVMRAPPVERVERRYSLSEIRSFERVRAIMPRIDFSEITFDTDSAYISPDQIDALEIIADIMLDMIDENPHTLFMIAGYTDRTGPYGYNIVLSERRAESVAIALTDYFGVLPENLVTQGYGPDFPKIDTPYAERANRRVEFINLTPLLARN